MNRRSFLAGSSAAAIIAASPAQAFWHGNGAPTGKVLIGSSSFDANSGPFLNHFAANTQLTCTSVSDFGATTSNFTADGYPVNGVSFSNSVSTQCVLAPWLKTTDQLYISWSGSLGLQMSLNGVTVVSGGSFVTQNSGGTFEVQGTNGLVVFTLSAIPTTQFPCYWYQSGGTHYTFSGASWLQFARYATAANYPTSGSRYTDQTILASLTNPTQFYSTDYINRIKAFNPRTWRPMSTRGFNANMLLARSSYKTNWATGFGILSDFTLPSTWAGAASNTGDAYSIPAPSGWAGLVDGATVQFYVTSANTTVGPTLNVGSTGAIQIYGYSSFPDDVADVFYRQNSYITIGEISTSKVMTAVYSATLNLWAVTPSAFEGGTTPIELNVALCNLVNCDYWHNIPHQYDNASVTAEAAYIAANLNSQLRGLFEWSNEVWNNAFEQNTWAAAMGQALGFLQGNLSYHGFRSQQVMNLVTSAWGSRGKLVRCLAVQGGGDTGTPSSYEFIGNEVSSGTSARTKISAITLGSTTTIQTATPHGLSNSASVFLGGSAYSTLNPGIVGALNVSATFNISASTTAASQNLTGTGTTIEIFNQTAATAFFVLGGNTATPNAKSFQVAAGAKIQITNNNQGSISVILSTGTGTVTVYQGSDLSTISAVTPTPYTATVIDTTHFSIPVNSTGWQAYVSGGTVYQAPTTANQPYKSHDCLPYATYWNGNSYGNAAMYNNSTLLAASSMITDCLNFSNGTSGQQATALSNMTADIVSSTGSSGNSSLLNLKTNYYPAWATVASTFGLTVENYEGGPQLSCPNMAQLAAANGTFTGSISGTTMTITAVSNGAIAVGLTITDIFGNGNITSGTVVTAFQSGTGGVGTYTVNHSQTVGSEQFNILPNGTTFPTETQFIAFFTAWNSSSAAYATTRQQLNDAISGGVVTPANFVFGQGPPISNLDAGWNLYPGTFFSTPWQLWQGVADFNHGI